MRTRRPAVTNMSKKINTSKRRKNKPLTCPYCTYTCMHTLLPRFAIRHTITLVLSLTRGSPAVVMAAVGTAERDFGVIPKAERCEM